MANLPKYTGLVLTSVSEGDNAFAIIGAVKKAMRHEGLTPDIFEEYKAEATNGDYDHLVATTRLYMDMD